MQEYRVKGLSCANCTRELEEQIRKLEYGETATLSYNSGKLMMDERISLADVERILRSDGAYIVKDEALHNKSQQLRHEHIHEDDDVHDHAHEHSGGLLKYQLIVAALLYLALLIWGEGLPAWAAISCYLFVMVISGYRTYWKGLKNLFRFKFTIDTLMTIALTGAVFIGEWQEATLVAILFGVNEWLEGVGMDRARRSVESLLKVAPKEARLIEDGIERIVPIGQLRVGDIVLIRSGDKIPSDGVVMEGDSSVNESAITGESLPVDKKVGDYVFGGSINNEGVLKIRIEKAYQDSSLARILHLVEEAQETKTPTELFINRFAKYYTPLILLIAFVLIFVPPVLFGADWGTWLYQGLAVLIVGCPCALILSSPIALVAGITRNARNGILVKGGVHLEQLGKIDTLAFDKTGTLTKGEPNVEEVIEYDDRFYSVAYALERSSSHPLAKAIMQHIGHLADDSTKPERIETTAGRGITAQVDNIRYWLGSEKIVPQEVMTDKVRADIEHLKEHGYTIVLLADEVHVLGIFGIADEVRAESKEVVAQLHKAGIRDTVMLTGDHPATAAKVAKAVGVRHFYSGLLPEDKVEKINELKKSGKVAMIGDGINDAPALATADLGIAMGKGADSAIETADIVLMQDHLGKLPQAIRVAKRVNRIIRFNITIAVTLKMIALLLTIPGMLTLWFAILSDMGATIMVTLISLSVLLQKREPKKQGSY